MIHSELLSALDNKLVSSFVVSSLVAARRLPPGSHRIATAAGLSFTTTMWVIDRIHCHTAHGRPMTEPTRAARLTKRDILMLNIANLSHRSHAFSLDLADLAAGQAQLRPFTLFRDQLRPRSRAARHLST